MSSTSPVAQSPALDEYRSNFDNIAKILLIGETGAGKSTFINYLYNYFNNGNLYNLKTIIPCKYHPCPTTNYSYDELKIDDVTQSKTNSCIQYMFEDPTTNKQYLFIDTPGLSDTRGIEQNKINMKKIIDATINLGSLTSVIIVINGSMSRLTMNLRSTLSSLHGNIPDVILENAIVILTNVKKYKSSFDLEVLHLHGKTYPFYMQNDAFVSDPQTWKESIFEELQYDWNRSMKQIKIILETIDSFKQVSTNAFNQMKQVRNEMQSLVHQARLELVQIQKIQDDLAQLDLSFKQADRDLVTYEDHTRVYAVDQIDLVDVPYYNTLCAVCNYVCHNNCHLGETKIVESQVFSQCLVMKHGSCQRCPNRCSFRAHYHAQKTIKITRETLHDILVDLKEKYDQAYESRNNYHEQIQTITETKQLLEKALKQKVHEIKNKSLELSELCSSFNLAQEFDVLMQQLKLESSLLRSLEAKSKAEKVIKYLTKFVNLFQENQAAKRQRVPMQIIHRDIPIETKPIEINKKTSSDLIDLYHTTPDQELKKSISNELHRRAQGVSTGPLSTPKEIMTTNKYFDKYKNQNVQELSYSYRKLQQQINRITEHDIFKIVEVDPEVLIENFIVQTLLDDKEKNENTHQNNFLPQAPALPSCYPPQMTDSYPGTPLKTTAPSERILPYPDIEFMPISRESSNTNIVSIGFSHLNIAPYPQYNESSSMPPLPSDYSRIGEQRALPPQPMFSLEDYQYNPMNQMPTRASVGQQNTLSALIPMPMSIPAPMQTNNQRNLTNLNNINAEFSFGSELVNQHNPLSSGRTSTPDVVPNITQIGESPKHSSGYIRNPSSSNLFNEDLTNIDTSRLLLMYADAVFKKLDSKREAVYDELERRCFGEYPQLIAENQSLLQEKIKNHQTKPIRELMMAQATIKQKIRSYLSNDDVTLIDDVPSDLIIEANALNRLVLSKQ